MATLAAVELCENCGQEWPSRFGRHNCNFYRAQVHKNSIICAPFQSLSDSLSLLTSRLEREATRSAEFADAAGEEAPYKHVLGDIDAAIGQLKRFRHEMQKIAGHAHDWNDDDYCSICGADGRA